MTLRLAVLGAGGRMGQLVCAQAAQGPDVRISRRIGRSAGEGIVPLAPGVFADTDVVVDFSSPAALLLAIPLIPPGVALVSGTTGLGSAGEDALAARVARGPVLWSANFSTGVAVLAEIVERVARSLSDFDVEIVEAHHSKKQDSPSGTAIALAQRVEAGWGATAAVVHGRSGAVGPRSRGELGVHAVRAGDTVGEHTVWFAGAGERLELKHVATSRVAFASGAIRAARWLAGRPPGRYSQADVVAG